MNNSKRNGIGRLIAVLSLAVLIVAPAFAQTTSYKLSGVVIDETGAPVPGASVMQQGTTNGVSTDIDGKFAIQLSGNATLVCDCLGYSTSTLNVSPSTGSVQFVLV